MEHPPLLTPAALPKVPALLLTPVALLSILASLLNPAALLSILASLLIPAVRAIPWVFLATSTLAATHPAWCRCPRLFRLGSFSHPGCRSNRWPVPMCSAGLRW
jgi:hypothetical protein